MEKDNKDDIIRDPEKLFQAIEGMVRGFNWGESKEGHEFWHTVQKRLKEINDGVESDLRADGRGDGDGEERDYDSGDGTDDNLRMVSKGSAERMSQDLYNGFEWRTSKEGHKYWEKIHARLQEIQIRLSGKTAPSVEKAEEVERVKNIDVEACKGAAGNITAAFEWSSTKEGSSYWNGITKRLRSIAEKG